MPRYKRNKRPFHRINHSLLNAQIGRKKQRIPTSAAFHHERKPFLSWDETLFITRTNLCHHDEKHKQSIFQKQQPNSTDKKPHPLHNEIANYADKNEHQ